MTPAIKKDANVTNNTKRDAATIEAALYSTRSSR